ncbi:MAG TPA: hypothetical protein DCW60_02685 [Sutterella sp.]|nr:hypothetical protein [Sutterella sp.]
MGLFSKKPKGDGPEDGDYTTYIDKLNKKEIAFETELPEGKDGTQNKVLAPEKKEPQPPVITRNPTPKPRSKKGLDPVFLGFMVGFFAFVIGGFLEEETILWGGFICCFVTIFAGGLFRRRK